MLSLLSGWILALLHELLEWINESCCLPMLHEHLEWIYEGFCLPLFAYFVGVGLDGMRYSKEKTGNISHV